MYLPDEYEYCQSDVGYTLLFVTERTVFDSFTPYAIEGEGNAAARYCVHPGS